MSGVRIRQDRFGRAKAAAVDSCRGRSVRPALTALLALVCGWFAIVPARADPQYPGPVLFGFDPVIRATEDPRLLGVQRLVLLRRLETWDLQPSREPDARPDLSRALRRQWMLRAGVDLKREKQLVEYNGPIGLLTEIRYPTFFFLFPPPEPLPGGFRYYPPRPLDDPVVRLFVDDLEGGARRRFAVARVHARIDGLDVAGAGRRNQQGAGLINLTIPIKLPRTLEKIIGRGEKTRIKITGRERIAITGESTVINPFTPTERVSSQSLFPTLDMEQELQINLSGTIGEKIIIEVDHNSAAIGPDATRIKLMYQGDEDEIIRTIETGDVGLTLPGSQLVGYSSNKSGLFGIKVTGQVGRADFVVVASKQKAESSAKTFNAKGGQVSDKIINSSEYLNNQFFRLDLPFSEPQGRQSGERIDLASVRIYELQGAGLDQPDDINHVAVYADTLGFRAWDSQNFSNPFEFGRRWRQRLDFEPLLDADGGLVSIDFKRNVGNETVLACVYDVVNANGTVVGTVGDDPGLVGAPSQEINDSNELHYRMKLLKAPTNRPVRHVFDYILRNIYSLGGSEIDVATFDLRIEQNNPGNDHPEKDENNIDYIRIFGLDQTNPQGGGAPDGVVDYNDPLLFDLERGLLKFPLNFPYPFAADEQLYRDYAQSDNFVWDGSFLKENLTPELYDPTVLPTEYNNYNKFRIVTSSSSASSNFNLGVSNIQEDSEVVTIDGVTKTRGVDYEIDYTFGELVLKGETANLTPDSKVSVTYQYSPFFGGGDTSLMGLNLGYDLGRNSKVGTTWLYQGESIVGEKAKLGEEPSRTVVGNLNLSHTMRPGFLTDVANLLSRQNTERESTVQFSGESAISLPNPNTKGRAHLEDFEGVDASDVITLTRLGWFWASVPYVGETDPDARIFQPENRADQVRWFLPKNRVLRRHLNPDLINQERDETQQAMNMYLREDDGVWDPEDWGGIMRGISRTGLDLSKSQFIEIWINDGQPIREQRRGRLHIDFGYIDEDGFWPDADGTPVVGTWEREDVNNDGIFIYDEDVGLDGNENGPQRFQADFEIDNDKPYPRINGTARNQREDDEDLNGNTKLDRDNGYFTTVIDLKDTEALVDVVYDYDDVQDLIEEKKSWRKYRIPVGAVDRYSGGTAPNIKAVTHARIWYEDPAGGGADAVEIQLSELKFLGSRWEREGVRRIDGERLLSADELPPDEEFFLGEVNNKENPDYRPPFPVPEINNIPEKEQALVLNYQNIQQGHMVRASKKVSAQGDDYTGYSTLTWYFYNPDHVNAEIDLFFRVGADTLNYYEVEYSFADSPDKAGWKALNLNIAELSNAKNGELAPDGSTVAVVNDFISGDPYLVRVVGRPDLRRIRAYYVGLKNRSLSQPATGYFYLNDVVLDGVKRDIGFANRAGLRLNMADVIKVDFDWRGQDAEYHGLGASRGSGVNSQDWTLSGSFNLDDFVPMAGFRLPVSASKQKSVQKPKYETNSDIEILDPAVQEELAAVDVSERFSTRLSRTPSKNAILRYTVDPWSFLLTGSRRNSDGPLRRQRDKNLSGSVNYDLRIAGLYRLGRYPIIKHIPIVKGVSFLPTKIAFGGNFSSAYSEAVTINQDGTEAPRPIVKNRPGKLTGNIDYRPLQIIDLAMGVTSDRDLLRPEKWGGVNVGQENQRTYNVRMTVLFPKPRVLGESSLLGPVRSVVRAVAKSRPNLSFQGGFADQHNPGIRQAGDPEDIRNVSNNGRWELRMDIPVGDAFKAVLPEQKYSSEDRSRLIAEQQRREQQALRGGGRGLDPNAGPGAAPQSDGTPQYPPEMTPEEIQRLEAERLLREAEEFAEREREMERAVAPPDSTAGGPRFNPLSLVMWIPNSLRNTTPLKVTFTNQKNSSYQRLTDMPNFWYQTGLVQTFDVADSLYAAYGFDKRTGVNLATTSKITKTLSVDVKYGESRTEREQIGSRTESYKRDWPEAQITLSGLESYRIFGGDPRDRSAGWFANSNINVSYKKTKNVANYTATSYNPSFNWTFSPRWTMNFHSGLSATLNATVSKDEKVSNAVISLTRRSRYGLQFRHQFNAQGFLAKMGLYRPGNSQSVNMNIDISYQRDRSERINPGGVPSSPTGSNRMNVNPQFTYQITNNLSGGLRFLFSRNRDVASGVTTTSLGMGVEATFVF